MVRTIATGVQDFDTIRRDGIFYIDKTKKHMNRIALSIFSFDNDTIQSGEWFRAVLYNAGAKEGQSQSY